MSKYAGHNMYSFMFCIAFLLSLQFNRAGATTTTPSPITLQDFPIYHIHEDTQIEVDLGAVDCTDTPIPILSNTTCPVCNIVSNENVPFRVWNKYNHDQFHVYYVGNTPSSGGLDWDVTSTYFLTIQCTSADGVSTVSKVLEIDVLPNQPPYVSNTSPASVTLDATSTLDNLIDRSVYQWNVKDNESDPISYTLYTDPYSDIFQIEQATGIIRQVKDLNTAVDSTIAVRVNITDGRSVVGPETVVVNIQNGNSRPYFTDTPANKSVFETLAANELIYSFTFNDDTFINSLTPTCSVFPNNENYKFRFTTYTNNRVDVYLNGTTSTTGDLLDYETTSYYNISCIVNDGYLNSVNGYINLFIQNVNEAPVFNEDLYYCIMDENYQNIGPCDLSGLSVVDPERNSIVEYKLLTGNNSERFRYDNANKLLAFDVDYDVDVNYPTSVRLTVAAIDDQGLTGTARIQVNIVDVNDNTPTFNTILNTNSYTVTQGQAVGAIGRVTATDADLTSPNNDITYSVAGGSLLDYVTVLGNGEVIYSKEFDTTLSGTSQHVYIVATDGGSPARSSTGTVIVSYETTTSTTTTTTTQTTTPTTTTAAAPAADPGFFDYAENIVLFCFLMFLLLLLLLAALYLLYRYCTHGSCIGPTRPGRPLCPDLGEGGCDDCFRPSKPAPQRKPELPMVRQPNANYKDPFWKSGDHYEDGAVARINVF